MSSVPGGPCLVDANDGTLHSMRRTILLCATVLGCSTAEIPLPDAADFAAADSGTSDAGDRALDAASADSDSGLDAGPGDGGEEFGALTAMCERLAPALSSTTTATLETVLDFGDDPYDPPDRPRLTAGARRIIDAGNAGGSSLLSEVFAFEVLARCADAELVATETEVAYDVPDSKRTDLVIDAFGRRVGVSVTRAVSFPRDAAYAADAARSLLDRKLEGINESSEHVQAEFRWTKQILHVIADTDDHARQFARAAERADPDLIRDTVLVLTTTEGSDDFLY